MPTGNCRFPEHHSPSAGRPVAWVILLALGAIVVTHWHTVLVCLVVAGVVVAAGLPVLLLIHNHRSGYDDELERQADLDRVQRIAAARRQQLARPAVHHHVHYNEAPPRQLAPPDVHNHLHLHGINPADIPAITARQPDPAAFIYEQQPALEEYQQ